MAARKINGAGDHAVTRTKTNFLFCGAAGPLDEHRLGGTGGLVGLCWMSGRLSIELQCRTRWQELLQHELRVLRQEPGDGLALGYQRGRKTLVYGEGWLIGPIAVQKEFKPLLFLSSSLLRAASTTGLGRGQGQSSHRAVIKREPWGWMNVLLGPLIDGQ